MTIWDFANNHPETFKHCISAICACIAFSVLFWAWTKL